MKNFFTSHKTFFICLIIVMIILLIIVYKNKAAASQIEPSIRPDGTPKGLSTLLLEFGSKILQSTSPLKDTNLYFAGFHPMKDHPQHQMEAHHYCKQVNEDFAQCLLYDGNTSNANLTGIEYIISEKLFNQLPAEEYKYWHPHNYEILSGQLIAPSLPPLVEKMVLKKKINSYGKTYHTWQTKYWEDGKPYLDTLPKGEAILAWSFNHDGEAKLEMVETRDKNIRVSTLQKRKERENMVKDARPQAGVDYLNSYFNNTISIPGVIDINDVEANKH